MKIRIVQESEFAEEALKLPLGHVTVPFGDNVNGEPLRVEAFFSRGHVRAAVHKLYTQGGCSSQEFETQAEIVQAAYLFPHLELVKDGVDSSEK